MHEELINKAQSIISNASGNYLDVYYALYEECIKPSDAPWRILKTILEYNDDIGSDDDSPSIITSEKEQELECYYPALKEITRMLARENSPEDVFYRKLYDGIFASNLFPEDDMTSAVILKMLSREVPDVPYYYLENIVDMGNEEYQQVLERIRPQIYKTFHVFNRNLSRTGEASQLLQTSYELDNEKDKAVYWSAVVAIIQRHYEKESS